MLLGAAWQWSWAQGGCKVKAASVLGRQVCLYTRDVRKASPHSIVIYFARSKSQVRPHKNIYLKAVEVRGSKL